MPRFEGTVNRDKPRVNVMRGYTGNEPQSLSRSAPPAVDIESGQAIKLDGSEEWILADGTLLISLIGLFKLDYFSFLKILAGLPIALE